MKRALAYAVYALVIGCAVEANAWEPKLWRVPVSGTIVLTAAAVITWAHNELEETNSGDNG